MHSTNSNQHSVASNMHSSITNTPINTYNLKMCICTPMMLQFSSLQTEWCFKCVLMHLQHDALQIFLWTPKTSQFSNQISKSSEWAHNLLTHDKLENKLHKQIHIHKSIWTMIGVRWSRPPLALPFITFFFLSLYNAYGISQLPLLTNLMGLFKSYSFLYL